jgi:hypothetical protein
MSDALTGSQKLVASKWPLIPIALATAAGVVAGLTAPEVPAGHALPGWFDSFFGISAGVIATLFVTLALGARQIKVDELLAWFTVVYVGVGEVAAVAGLSAELPHGAYPVLLGVTVGAGLGALVSAVIIGGTAISVDEAARRKSWLKQLREP